MSWLLYKFIDDMSNMYNDVSVKHNKSLLGLLLY